MPVYPCILIMTIVSALELLCGEDGVDVGDSIWTKDEIYMVELSFVFGLLFKDIVIFIEKEKVSRIFFVVA